MSLELRRRLMVQAEPKDIIIDARKGGVSGDAANDAALMEIIYAQGWSKSPLYMTQREAENVTSIGTAFSGNEKIKSFEAFMYFIGVSELVQSAFQKCTSLTTITIPKNITNIGGNSDWSEASFSGCSSLQEVVWSNDSKLKSFYGRVFAGSLLTECKVPDTVVHLSHAFRQCAKLTTAYIPPKVTRIINAAFLNCTNLKNIYIGKNVTECNINSFSGTPSKNIYFNGTIEDWYTNKYGDLRKSGFTLYMYNSHTQEYEPIPSTITIENNIQDGYAFAGQNTIENVIINDSVTSLSKNTFSGCKNLKTVELGNGITSLSDTTFKGCTSLEECDIPNSITEIYGIYN